MEWRKLEYPKILIDYASSDTMTPTETNNQLYRNGLQVPTPLMEHTSNIMTTFQVRQRSSSSPNIRPTFEWTEEEKNVTNTRNGIREGGHCRDVQEEIYSETTMKLLDRSRKLKEFHETIRPSPVYRMSYSHKQANEIIMQHKTLFF